MIFYGDYTPHSSLNHTIYVIQAIILNLIIHEMLYLGYIQQ